MNDKTKTQIASLEAENLRLRGLLREAHRELIDVRNETACAKKEAASERAKREMAFHQLKLERLSRHSFISRGKRLIRRLMGR